MPCGSLLFGHDIADDQTPGVVHDILKAVWEATAVGFDGAEVDLRDSGRAELRDAGGFSCQGIFEAVVGFDYAGSVRRGDDGLFED